MKIQELILSLTIYITVLFPWNVIAMSKRRSLVQQARDVLYKQLISEDFLQDFKTHEACLTDLQIPEQAEALLLSDKSRNSLIEASNLPYRKHIFRDEQIQRACFSNDNTELVLATNNDLIVYDYQSNTIQDRISLGIASSQIASLALDKSRRYIAVAAINSYIYDRTTKKPLTIFFPNADGVLFSPVGMYAVWASQYTITMYDFLQRSEIESIRRYESMMLCHDTQDLLAAIDHKDNLIVYDMSNKISLCDRTLEKDVNGFAWVPDNNQLIMYSTCSGMFCIINYETGAVLINLTYSNNYDLYKAIPSERRLRAIAIIPRKSNAKKTDPCDDSDVLAPVYTYRYSNDCNFIVQGGTDGALIVYDCRPLLFLINNVIQCDNFNDFLLLKLISNSQKYDLDVDGIKKLAVRFKNKQLQAAYTI